MLKIDNRMYNLAHVTGIVDNHAYLYLYVSGFPASLRVDAPHYYRVKQTVINYWEQKDIQASQILELQSRINKLEKSNEELREQIQYMPGGPVYKEAEDHFNSIKP
jgi:hypothetical protein